MFVCAFVRVYVRSPPLYLSQTDRFTARLNTGAGQRYQLIGKSERVREREWNGSVIT